MSEEHKELVLLAAFAMQGMLAHDRRYFPRDGAASGWHAMLAQEAFEVARAMQAEAAKHVE